MDRKPVHHLWKRPPWAYKSMSEAPTGETGKGFCYSWSKQLQSHGLDVSSEPKSGKFHCDIHSHNHCVSNLPFLHRDKNRVPCLLVLCATLQLHECILLSLLYLWQKNLRRGAGVFCFLFYVLFLIQIPGPNPEQHQTPRVLLWGSVLPGKLLGWCLGTIKPKNFCHRQVSLPLQRSISRPKVFKTPFPDPILSRIPSSEARLRRWRGNLFIAGSFPLQPTHPASC